MIIKPFVGDFKISQRFGENPNMYSPFGMLGHNGIDWALPQGTVIIAPFSGFLVYKNSGKDGYGKHIKLRTFFGKECILGHLSSCTHKENEIVFVNMGDWIGASGDTGFSTGPHLHVGLRRLDCVITANGTVYDGVDYLDKDKTIFDIKVKNYDNGFFGGYDFIDFVI